MPAHGIVGLSLTHYGLLHVRFHFREALTEPTLAVQETADLTVIQNAVEVFHPRQMIDHGRWGYFHIGHVSFLLHLQRGHWTASEQTVCRHVGNLLYTCTLLCGLCCRYDLVTQQGVVRYMDDLIDRLHGTRTEPL